jgi:hypothetical protein
MSGVTLLLGFGNSTMRQMEPYARIWRDLGMEAQIHIGSPIVALACPEMEAKRAHEAAHRLAFARRDRDVFVHAMSDNGFVAYALILEALLATPEGARTRDAIRGVVFDSTPGIHLGTSRARFAQRFAIGMTPAILRSMRRAPDEHHPILTPLLEAAFHGVYAARPEIGLRLARAYDRVVRWQPRAPQLYLYGDADVLVSKQAVEAHVAEQREAGFEVRAVCFAGARHVACYPSDPETYRSEIARLATRSPR